MAAILQGPLKTDTLRSISARQFPDIFPIISSFLKGIYAGPIIHTNA
jgi:hypothetical protein